MSSRVRPLVLALIAAVLPAGCGDGEAAGEQRPARLVVREELPAMPRYIEGSLSFLRITRVGSGELIADGPVTDGRQVRGRDPLLRRELAPGEYRLVSYQRPCAGNCHHLDPPVDRCEATVRLAPGASLTATVRLAQGGGCTWVSASEPLTLHTPR